MDQAIWRKTLFVRLWGEVKQGSSCIGSFASRVTFCRRPETVLMYVRLI